MSLAPTPGQTVGPFFSFALVREGYADLVSPAHPDAITLHGRVLDGAGEPVPDALVELTRGGNDGWGRAPTDDEGRYTFTTLAPAGRFFAITVFARGPSHRCHRGSARSARPAPARRRRRGPDRGG